MSEVPAQTRHLLPAQVTPFIGRTRELEQIGHWLEDDSTRLITIVGMGGMGKTRLALEAARQHIGHFEDGVFFVPFAAGDDLLTAIANAIGLRLTAIDSLLQELKIYLAQEHLLLVLDNFERLVDQGALLVDLLAAAPFCKILVTSRQRLNLRTETLLWLAGMEVKAWLTLAQATDASVIQLFCDSARRGRPDFELTEQNFRQVVEICALVEGMPLGVELAAAWTSSLTLEEIARGIRNSVDFLEIEYQDMPERHRRMRTVLEQSYQLLPVVEQQIFVQLCVFHDGFTPEAAGAITGVDRAMLATLVNKSLIHHDLQGRYTIHELLRQFGQAMLDHDIFTRHARFYCRLLSDLSQALLFGDIEAVCRRIDPEFANVRSAWAWAARHEMYDELMASCTALACYRDYRSRFVESRQVYSAAIGALRQAVASRKRDVALAWLLSCQSWVALRFGQLEEGLQTAQESWDLLTRHHLTRIHSLYVDPRQPMTVLLTLLGNVDAARQVAQEMLHSYAEHDDLFGVGMACYTLTVVELAAGDYLAVRQVGMQGYEAFHRTKHFFVQAHLLMNWANAERALGNIEEARRLFQESYDNMRAVGALDGQATALTYLAQLTLAQGEYEEARRIFEANLAIFRQIGDSGGMAVALEGLAQIAIVQKQSRQSARLLVEALDTTGVRLPSYTLSLLLCACQLPSTPELRAQVVGAIQCHPAAKEELKRRAATSLIAPHPSPPALEKLVTEMKRCLALLATQTDQPDALTAREMDILRLLAWGLSNREIAERLVMTVGTIKWYLNHMYAKLQVKNRTEAVAHARKLHLLP